MAAKDAEKRLFKKWRDDHAAFVHDAILMPYNEAKGTVFTMTPQQKEASEALSKLIKTKREGKARDILGISIMSGKGTGKDAWSSWAILWFMTCFSYPKVPCVSVSADQLNKVLWSEISKWLMHSAVRDQFTLQNDKLFYNNLTVGERGKRWIAFPKAANPKQTFEEQVETLAGIHEDHLLQVVDEGSGILENVFQVLEGNMTGPVNLMLLIFNPTRSKGYAIDSQYRHSDRWHCFRWNAEDSPIVDRGAIERLAQDYGTDSNTYRVKVLGLPPITDEQVLIPWDWIQDAINRPLEPVPNAPLVKGLDCGAGGNKSVIATRRGPIVYPFKRNTTPDSVQLSNWAGTDIDAEQPDVMRVDTIGIGWAVEGSLREKKGSVIEPADARRTADDQAKFYNKRAEMYWLLRDQFQHGTITIPDDPDLQNQLGAMKCEYHKSQIKIVEKKKIIQEIGHSPDEAEALALTYFYPDHMISRNKGSRRHVDRAPTRNATAWMGS